MTGVGTIYGHALYSLVKEEGNSDAVYEELKILKQSLQMEPDYLRLLSSPNLSKAERCNILDDSFRGKIQPYVLNFLKLLTEKGYIQQFYKCAASFEEKYHMDHNILKVKVTTTIPISKEQSEKLIKKLSEMTGKHINLENRVDPECLGGVRLDFDGKCLDDTIAHRLKYIGNMFKNTVLN